MRESIMTYFFIQGSGFRVQGSGGGFAAFLEEGIPDTLPSPRGEGAPKGRIGYWRYEREWGKRRSVSFMKATERLIYLRRSRHLHSLFEQIFHPQ